MKLSDKALAKIGMELLGGADDDLRQHNPPPSRHNQTTPTRGMRPGAFSRACKATVLTFRKRRR